jgi:exosome complex component RRP42
MATVRLSAEERSFIISGITENFRIDGRSRQDFRKFEIKRNVISNTNGSAQLQLGNTSVLVGVKAELDSPTKSAPDCGKVQFFVDCSALASPEFEGREGEELGSHLSEMISHAYSRGKCMNLSSLCIIPGKACWNLYIDAVVSCVLVTEMPVNSQSHNVHGAKGIL